MESCRQLTGCKKSTTSRPPCCTATTCAPQLLPNTPLQRTLWSGGLTGELIRLLGQKRTPASGWFASVPSAEGNVVGISFTRGVEDSLAKPTPWPSWCDSTQRGPARSAQCPTYRSPSRLSPILTGDSSSPKPMAVGAPALRVAPHPPVFGSPGPAGRQSVGPVGPAADRPRRWLNHPRAAREPWSCPLPVDHCMARRLFLAVAPAIKKTCQNTPRRVRRTGVRSRTAGASGCQ